MGSLAGQVRDASYSDVRGPLHEKVDLSQQSLTPLAGKNNCSLTSKWRPTSESNYPVTVKNQIYTNRAYPQRVLMLGAGFVTRPTLDVLVESGIAMTVGMASFAT